MGNIIEEQALDFANVHLVDRNIKASVHLENWEDVLFWDTLIQRVSPGSYNYIAYSKSESGQETSGSSQCKKYLPYLSSRFFVCIDSDLNYLTQAPDLDAEHYVAQTYTYSWENHYSQSEALQKRFNEVAPFLKETFDFGKFLSAYSHIVFRPLLALLYCLRTHDNRISPTKLFGCLPHQCSSADLENNGEGYLNRIQHNLDEMIRESGILDTIDFSSEQDYYMSLGLNANNAYLHIRGHNLYDLLVSIGRQLCSRHQIDFENDILNHSLPKSDSYWEITKVSEDLSIIVSLI